MNVFSITTCSMLRGCINQLDPEAKALGIASLGSILDRSERMLILMDEHYFSSLWCIFEVSDTFSASVAMRLGTAPMESCFELTCRYRDILRFFCLRHAITCIALRCGLFGAMSNCPSSPGCGFLQAGRVASNGLLAAGIGIF